MGKATKSGKKPAIVDNQDMVWAVTTLHIMGGSMSKVSRLLGLHRDTIKRVLETNEARALVDEMKRLVLLLGPKALGVLAKDLAYDGEDPNRLKLRNKTALNVLQSPGVLPTGKSDGQPYIDERPKEPDPDFQNMSQEELYDWLMRQIGYNGGKG